MKWAYDLTGAEPIISDIMAYDSATIAQGELLMQSAGSFTAGAGAAMAAITAADTSAAAAVNAIGISLETKTTADSPSIATACNVSTAAGACYVKAIINPFAVYRAEVTTAAALPIASSSSIGSFCVTGAGASTAMNDGQGNWAFFCGSAGPNFGSLRKVVNTATAGTFLMDANCLATITTADTVIMATERTRPAGLLHTDAISIGQSTITLSVSLNTRVVQNYIDRGAGLEILKASTHAGGRVNVGAVQAKKTKLYQDIMMKDHLFGVDI